MKKAGIVLIALGFYCVLFAFNMDVVVGTTYNIGLMNERQNVVFLSGIIFLAGIILVGFGFSAKEESKSLKLFSIACFLLPVLLLVGIKSIVYVQNMDESGTITFKDTGLTWQRCAVGQTWVNETCEGNAKRFSWYEAMKLTSNFAGKNDWRLPTNEELKSLVYCSDNQYRNLGKEEAGYICKNNSFGDIQTNIPVVNVTYFPNFPIIPHGYFWSSTPSNNTEYDAWTINFESSSNMVSRKNDQCVLLVRSEH